MKCKMPFAPCHFEANEYWLNQKVNEGWTLVSIKGRQVEFKEEKKRIAYHIDPSHAGFQKLLNNKGWKPECRYDSHMSVYANESAKPLIPYVEPESSDVEVLRLVRQREESKWFLRSAIFPLIMFMLLVAAFVFYNGQEANMLLRDYVPFAIAAAFVIFGMGLYVLVTRMIRLMKWFYKRQQMPREDFYGKIKDRQEKVFPTKDKVTPILWYVGLGFVAVVIVLFLTSLISHKVGPIESYEKNYVTLEQIEGQPLISAEIDGFSNYYIHDASFQVPRQDILYQGGYLGEESRALRITYLQASSDSLAVDLLESRRYEELSWNDFMYKYSQRIEVEGAEDAYYTGYNNMQYLFLRQGKTVIAVFYLGGEKLDEKASLFLE